MKHQGEIAIALICAAPPFLWLNAVGATDPFADATRGLTSLGVVLGLAGASSYAVNLTLGARLRVLERLFGGVLEMYRVHRGNGRVAFVLLALHAASMIAAQARLGALGLLLDDPRIVLGIVALVAMTVSIVLTLYVRLNHEIFVYVQRSFGFIFILAAFHIFAKVDVAAVRGYMAVLTGAGLLAFAYRSLFGDLLVRRHGYTVADVERRGDITHITMAPQRDPLRFDPGQFAFVTFESEAMTRAFHPVEMRAEGQSAVIDLRVGAVANQFHPFSIVSAPAQRELEVAVKAVGDYTAALRHLQPGDAAVVEGPYGEFSHVRVSGKRQVWLAGGIGVTPFLSMARSLDANDLDVDLYYCTKDRAEAHFEPELGAIADRHPGFRLILYAEDEQGLITADVVAETSGDPRDRDIFICGPPRMIHALRDQFLSRGVAPQRIHYEEFAFGPKR